MPRAISVHPFGKRAFELPVAIDLNERLARLPATDLFVTEAVVHSVRRLRRQFCFHNDASSCIQTPELTLDCRIFPATMCMLTGTWKRAKENVERIRPRTRGL